MWQQNPGESAGHSRNRGNDMKLVARWAVLGIVVVAAACMSASRGGAGSGVGKAGSGPASGLARIEHIIVIYAENRSFDHLYGLFPGANGIAQATAEQKTQVDHDGKPFATLPPVWKPGTREPDPRFPRQMANAPFRL